MMLMGLSTFCVGLLPSYATIGIWAPILLVTLRLIQGFAVGGELAGAGSMILEHSPFGRRGYFSSFTLQGVQAGQILAAAVFLPLAALTARRRLPELGLADPVPAQRVRGSCGLHHPSTGRRDAGVQGGGSPRRGAQGADRHGGQGEWRRHAPGHLHGADERRSDHGDRLRGDLCDQRGLRSRVEDVRLPLDHGGREHRRGDPHPVRRQPLRSDRSTPGHHRRLSRGGAPRIPVSVCGEPREPPAGIPSRRPDVGHRLPGLQRRLPVVLSGTVPDQDAGLGVRRVAEHRHLDHRVPARDLRDARRPDAGRVRGEQEVHAGHGPAVGRNLPGGGRRRRRPGDSGRRHASRSCLQQSPQSRRSPHAKHPGFT